MISCTNPSPSGAGSAGRTSVTNPRMDVKEIVSIVMNEEAVDAGFTGKELNASMLAPLRVALLLGVALLLAGWVSAQRGPVIYAIIHEQDALALSDLFFEQTGLQASLLRGATGEIITRVLAEQNNPQADIVPGGPSTPHILPAGAGAIEPYLAPAPPTPPPDTFEPQATWAGWQF